jgi:hypothetical protein
MVSSAKMNAWITATRRSTPFQRTFGSHSTMGGSSAMIPIMTVPANTLPKSRSASVNGFTASSMALRKGAMTGTPCL